jgi:hypothetical protein
MRVTCHACCSGSEKISMFFVGEWRSGFRLTERDVRCVRDAQATQDNSVKLRTVDGR